MQFYVMKARSTGKYCVTETKSGYTKEGIARRTAIKAAKTWEYVEYGRYDETLPFPKNHVITIFIDNEEQGGDKLWESSMQVSRQVLEEAPTKVGVGQTEI